MWKNREDLKNAKMEKRERKSEDSHWLSITQVAQAVAYALKIDISLVRITASTTEKISNGGCTGGSGTSEVFQHCHCRCHCTTLHFIAVHCTSLHYTALHSSAQHCAALHLTPHLGAHSMCSPVFTTLPLLLL